MSQINLELVRDTYSRDMGTFGKLSVLVNSAETVLTVTTRPGQTTEYGSPIIEKVFECETVERPWCQDEPNISCIPEGVYPLRRRRFYRGGYNALEICDVPGRSLILIHIANTMLEVEGCVGVGEKRGFVNQQWAVTNSKITFGVLMDLMTATRDQDPTLGSITIRQHRPDMVRFVDGTP